jgi:hypothetical protein
MLQDCPVFTLAPENPGWIGIDLSKQSVEVAAWSSVEILVPARIPVRAIEFPRMGLWFEAELSDHDLNPPFGILECRPFLKEGDAATAKAESKPYLIAEMGWHSLFAVGNELVLNLLLDQFRQRQGRPLVTSF